MSPEAFLKEFGHLAETEGGLGKLRQMVLELAVAGRFSEGKVGWKASSLATVGRWAIGSGFPKNAQGRDDLPLLFCKVSDMNLPGNEVEIRSTVHTIDHDLAKKIRAKLHPEGTIIFPKIGGAIATNKRRKLIQPTAIDNNCLGITPARDCSSDFLLTVLRSIDFTKYQVGTSVPALSQGVIGEIPIWLPPLPEQKRIVQKVDQLMALCDELEAKQKEKRARAVSFNQAALNAVVHAPDKSKLKSSWSRVQDHFEMLYELPENVKELRQTILQLAVTGKLVRQEAGDEPASELLDRIAARLPDRKKRSSTRQANGDDLNPDRKLPSGWSWASFPDLGEFGRGKSKHRPRNDPKLFSGGTFPVVQTGDVAQASPFVTTYRSKYNDFGLSQSKLWPKGTMCITIAANIADTGILSFDACFPDSVVGFVPDEELGGPSYFEFFVRTAKDRLEDYAPATAQKNINLTILEEVKIPVPPLAEQRRIIERAGLFMTLCDDLEVTLSQHRSQGQRLMQAVVEGLVA